MYVCVFAREIFSFYFKNSNDYYDYYPTVILLEKNKIKIFFLMHN